MSPIDRDKFYKSVRQSIFHGKILPKQFEGLEALLNEWDKRDLDDVRWLAYILATTLHETAHTMQPIEEFGKGKGYKYGVPDKETGKVYFGRGFCQLTHKFNYKQFGDLLGIDLVNHPEFALKLDIATDILFIGMIKGLYTGKKLSDYFSPKKDDAVNARKIVNGLDKAELIAGYHKEFLTALS